jgi:gliding motility-associated-like protein
MWVTVCDSALCDTVWVWINIEDVLMLDAVNDEAISNSGGIEIDILANDIFTDVNDLSISIVSANGNALVEVSDGVLIYSPNWDYCGIDSVSYSICDGQGVCDTAWVLIQVSPIDSDGDGIPDYIETLTIDTDGDGVLNYLSDDSDGDGLPDSLESGLQDLCSTALLDCDADGVPDYIDMDECDGDTVIPEGLSLNGDGINDYWIIPNIDQYPDNEVVIYNRWGNVVYQAQPYRNDWSGESNQAGLMGKNLLPEGTYFYIVRLRREDDAKIGYLYIKQ